MEIMKNWKKTYSYNDISIVSRVISELKHRNEADTSIEFCGVKLDIPIVAAPMPDICNGELALSLAKMGVLGIIHRFQSIDTQYNEYQSCFDFISPDKHIDFRNIVGCAIGITGDYQERFNKLYIGGCRIFCLDTANGANFQIKNVMHWICNEYISSADSEYEKLYIIGGNVATKEGFVFLSDLGIDAIRVGIGTSGICETRTETGIYQHQVSALLECIEIKDRYRLETKIIADGGIKIPADMCKALAVGADVVMCGNIFAGTTESPGNVLKIDGKLKKLYRGAASYSVQQENGRNDIEYNEGGESLVEYKGSVEKVVKRFKAGLQSSMSYLGARTLQEYQQNASIVLL